MVKTKVIFRLLNGEVLAIFPEVAATMDARHCSSYARVGQHGAADAAGVIFNSRPAKPAEYAALKQELEEHYEYELVVIQRVPGGAYQTRLNDIKAVGRA